MPIPKPTKSEKQAAFVSRCMGDGVMSAEYPHRAQRAAVCFSQWRRGKPEGKAVSTEKRAVMYSLKPEAKVSVETDDAGWVEGYAAVWGKVDWADDYVERGAFTKTIQERVAAGKVKLLSNHLLYSTDVTNVVGTITEAREDDYGLWIHAEFSNTDAAQVARQLVMEGHVWAFSIGGHTMRSETRVIGEERFRVIQEFALAEVSLVAAPQIEGAAITEAKGLSILDETDSLRKEVEAALSEGRPLTSQQEIRIGQLDKALEKARESLLALTVKPIAPRNVTGVASHWAVEIRRRQLALQKLSVVSESPSGTKH